MKLKARQKKAEKLVGQKFNHLTCIEFLGIQDKNTRYLYKWQCDCGNTIIAPSNNIKYGIVKACGCKMWEKNFNKAFKNNKLGILDIYPYHKRKNGEYSYRVQIRKKGVRIVKVFKTLEEAIEFRDKIKS